MPLPEPRPNETHEEFDARCMDDEAMQSEYPDQTQRYAVCQSIWNDRNKEPNERMLQALAERNQRKTLHGYGIRTAADYVRGAIGDGDMIIGPMSFEADGSATRQWDRGELLKEASAKLVYSNEETRADNDLITGGSDIDMQCKALKVDKPPRTLALFEAVLTTPRKDRDGDILRSEGAIIDPKMVTLWHHMMPMPVGILLAVTQHSSRRVKIVSTVVDKPLGLDTMHLLEHRALRMSHGFRPLRFEPLPTKNKDEPPGFDVKEFEVMEASVVTVPSNPETEAWITAYSRDKLHSPEAKRIAERMFGERPVIVPGHTLETGSDPNTVTVRVVVDDAAVRIKQQQDFNEGRMPRVTVDKTVPPNPSGGDGEGVEGDWSKPRLGDFTDESWEKLSGAEQRRIASYFAWYPNLETFDGLELPHHFPPNHAKAGKASLAGVRNALARMGQVQGMPADAKERAGAHLRKHLPKKRETEPKSQDTRTAIDAKAVRAATTKAIQRAISGAEQGQR